MTSRRQFLKWGAFAAVAPMPLSFAAAPRTVTSRQSGPWSSPSTWIGGKPPGAHDCVCIEPGHRITFDGLTQRLPGEVRVFGVLSFAHA